MMLTDYPAAREWPLRCKVHYRASLETNEHCMRCKTNKFEHDGSSHGQNFNRECHGSFQTQKAAIVGVKAATVVDDGRRL